MNTKLNPGVGKNLAEATSRVSLPCSLEAGRGSILATYVYINDLLQLEQVHASL